MERRIVCVGGGPAGLYTAITARLAGARDEIVVVERNPPGVTHGWGVVFWDDLLDTMHRNDPVSARALSAAAEVWDGQLLQVGRRAPVFLGGSGYAVGRQELLGLLTARARELDVDVRFGTSDPGPDLLAGADVVVAADGVNSARRAAHEAALGARATLSWHPYIWLGTARRFPTFTFGFVDTGAGWMWCHAYAFRADRSTFIVECPEPTWRALGLDRMPVEACLRALEELFAHLLDGESLLVAEAQRPAPDRPAPWTRFQRVELGRWHVGNLVLVGDAAHTTHFTIGSGTSLALGDARALGARLADEGPLAEAFAGYEAERRAVLAPLQDEADRSTAWFADLVRPSAAPTSSARPGDAVDDLHLAWSLWRRRGDAPTWRWHLLRATQQPALRRLRRGASSVRRGLRARRREHDASRRDAVG
ncbi:FAD-binding monooxygenase [Actinomycetospora sp. NBRC 106375]|uniref:FAD-dependent monooxygenase n=1 Tax=Actinomycetospora sp. NBRC 106375 TaxID=3032207 RepID=UPI0024A5CA34|nr:FAD-dependent monooxygenase [Actinomycetospora sp. NBRC 106375]GLZ47783.1 FAD-binding monooxygenase [Actinomycetospora sp. NBRC 106375]